MSSNDKNGNLVIKLHFFAIFAFNMEHKTAILLFSRSVAAESLSKQLLGKNAINKQLVARMIGQTKATLARAGLAVFVLDESQQTQGHFGQRLSVAAQWVFDQGFDRLIVVGNDCPELSVFHLQSAAKKLALGHSVLGKDQRMGAYLIGLQRDNFQAEAFAVLPWQTSDLAAALAAHLSAQGELCSLPSLRDINTTADFRALSLLCLRLRYLAAFALFADLNQLFADVVKPFFALLSTGPSLSRRGPPFISSWQHA